MENKECKVTYIEDLETDFEVKPAEIIINKYKIYGRTNERGYKLLATKKDKQKAIDYAKKLNKKIYNSALVIESSSKEDFPIDLER